LRLTGGARQANIHSSPFRPLAKPLIQHRIEVYVKKRLALILVALSCVACQKAPAESATEAAEPAQAAGQASPESAQPPAKPVPAELPAVLARVNGEALDRAQFEQAIKVAESRAGQPVPADQRDEVYREILDQLISYRLLVQETAARKLTVPEGEIDGRMAQLRQQFPSEDAFKAALGAQGLTVEKLRDEARTDMLVSQLMQEQVAAKVSVGQADVKTFYDENIERFKQGESVKASHILFRLPENADSPAKKETRARAEKVLASVRSGGDFAALARDNSQDPGSAAQGGDLGFFARGQMVPVFEEAAFALKPGEVSGIVESDFGFHIIKVAERRPARTIPLDEVDEDVMQFLTEQKRQEKSEAFIQELKTKSKIEIYI
jgi:peptidyl-prolyl cis-trans isomerase C